MATLNEDAFWRFSIDLYSREPIKQACLAMQDQFNLNVNVTLLCCWLDSLQMKLDKPQLDELLNAIKDSDAELKQHRQLRMASKNRPDSYAQLLREELELERVQQRTLIKALNSMDVAHVSTAQQHSQSRFIGNTQLRLSVLDARDNSYLSVFKEYPYKNV